MSRTSRLAALAMVIGSAAMASGVDASQRVVVVELFTSQACSACPPGDALLAELAQRDDVIALAFHVDYWSYLGWVDPFATPASTQRQKDYAAAFHARAVYTPQLVINGTEALIGSRRGEALAAVSLALTTPMPVAVSIDRDAEGLFATIEADPDFAAPARLVFVAYAPPSRVTITRGENAGRSFVFHRAVRDVRPLGKVGGGRAGWRLPGAEGAGGVAVLVQSMDDSRVVGAASYDFEADSSPLAVAGVPVAVP